MWVFENLKPSRRQTLSALYLMFKNLKWLFVKNTNHLDVSDEWYVALLLFPRMLELMNDIEDGDETEWFPPFTCTDPFFRIWKLKRPTMPDITTFDDFLHLLKYESVLIEGTCFEAFAQKLNHDSEHFDLEDIDEGPLSKFVRLVVTCFK